MKRLFFIFCMAFLCADVTEFPQIVDFRKIPLFQDGLLYTPPDSWTSRLSQEAYEMGYIGFNDAPEIGIYINWLREKYQLETVVETGTFFGASSLYFSKYFDQVYTIEASAKFYDDVSKRFQGHHNIQCCLGGSEKVLPELLPRLKESRVLFYLDAHVYWVEAEKGGYHYWPILEELEAISQTHKDNCIVVIDDCYVPGTNIRGCVDKNFQNELSHDLVREKLRKIFTGYEFHYFVPKNVQRAAKFIAIPKKWAYADRNYVGCIDVLPGQDFFEAIRTDLKPLKNAGYDIRISHQFVGGKDQGDYLTEISHDVDLKKIIVLNNTVDPAYLRQMPKDKLVMFFFEPMEISHDYFDPCSRVYTWDDDLVDNVKFFKLYYPHLMPMIAQVPDFTEKKLCVMISGSDNVYPERRNELYSERMKMIDFFETKPAGEFDLYGRYFVKRAYRDYKGGIPGHYSGPEKLAVLKNYRFCICFENTKDLRGYISEKIFDCFAAGCVPIYWGAHNVSDYIPANCFIDYRDFTGREEMYQFIKHMPRSVYRQYIENIQAFLQSKEATRFSPAYLEQLFMQAVEE